MSLGSDAWIEVVNTDAVAMHKLQHTHTHTENQMGTKNIAISDEAYQMLKALKKSGESFTDVIERMTRKSSVLDLTGILSKREVATVERRVKEVRNRSSRRIAQTAGALE